MLKNDGVPGSSVFVVNVKDGGKCHLASASAMLLPRHKRRSLCGWRFGSAAALASTISVTWGNLCRKCFPKVIVPDDGDVSPIEAYA